MYAVIRTGGRQYRAEPGHVIDVEKLVVDKDASLDIADVLLVVGDDGSVSVGQPTVAGAVVTVTVVEHYRARKIFVWHYKPGQKYRRRRGHRQTYTRLRIDAITV